MADQDEPMTKEISGPSDVGGFGLTPAFANRVYVLVRPDTTRIAFGEYVAGDPELDTSFHTALVMPTQDALALANLILQLFEKNQARHAQAPEKTTQPKADGNG